MTATHAVAGAREAREPREAGVARGAPGARGARGARGTPVLVTDGDERTALAATRSLVAAGHEVWVAARRSPSLAGVARGARAVRVAADALRDPAGFAREVGEVARAVGAVLLLPVTDASVGAVLEHASAIPPGVRLPFPDARVFSLASDKVAALTLAHDAGLDVPASTLLPARAAISRANLAPFLPGVIKPHRSVVTDTRGAARKLGVTFAENAGECRRALEALPECAYPVLVQRRVHGAGEGLFALRWNGRIVAQFAHRRLREKPPAGGVSVYRESIDLPPALAASAHRLLDRLDWCGVAMIECKRDDRTGRHVFMEVNGRLWGSLQLAIDAGVDFPALLAACALGEAPREMPAYRVGVRSRWFWGDVDHLYLRMTRSHRALHLDGAVASRLQAARDFLRFGRGGDREEIWRLRDPAPFLLETVRRLSPLR